MKRSVSFAAMIAVILASPVVLPSPVAAQAVQTTPDAGQATREALVRKYFDAIHFDKLLDTMIASMTEQQLASSQAQSLTPERRAAIVEAIRGAMHDVFPNMMDRFAQLYAETLTEQELSAMVRFYESDIGQSVMLKSQVLAGQSGSMIQEFTPQIEAAMTSRLCAETACPEAAGSPKGH